jgi:hypothetical protein
VSKASSCLRKSKPVKIPREFIFALVTSLLPWNLPTGSVSIAPLSARSLLHTQECRAP